MLTGADVGSTVRSEVTASNDAARHRGLRATTPSTRPAGQHDAPRLRHVRDGQTLTPHGTWTGTAPITYTYQWQRCDADGTNCADIARRDRLDLHPHGRRRRRTVRVEVTATNVAGNDAANSVADRRGGRRPARQHGRPDPLRRAARRPDAHARPRHLDRHRARSTTHRVAALRRSPARTARRSPARPGAPTRSPAPTSTHASASWSPPPTPPATPTAVSPRRRRRSPTRPRTPRCRASPATASTARR